MKNSEKKMHIAEELRVNAFYISNSGTNSEQVFEKW